MRRTLILAVTIAVLGGAACGEAERRPADDLLYLRTTGGVAMIQPGAAAATFKSMTAEPAPDWETTVQTETVGSGTNVSAVDPKTGAVVWQRTLKGGLRTKVVSPGARFVALAPNNARYYETPHKTRVIVTGRDMATPRIIALNGNFEPEAFSTDGSNLFVVQYLPARDPNRYQVRRLELATGKVQDVFSVDKELQEAMRGTARVQQMSPDGTRLYTLYTLNTPHGVHSFVHVLSLDELWAHCVDLPEGFAVHGDKRTAIAVAPDGKKVFVADTSAAQVAELDAERLTVAETTELDLPGVGMGAKMTVSADGSAIYLAAGERLVKLVATNLNADSTWELGDKIVGVQVAEDDAMVYVGLPHEVVAIAADGRTEPERFDLPGLRRMTHMGSVTRGLDPARQEIVCGC